MRQARHTTISGRIIPSLVFSLVGLGMAAPALASYAPGFVWDRSADWAGGAAEGEAVGNPEADSEGNGTWSYEAVRGGGLASDDPWYAQTGALMTADTDWFGSGDVVWSLGSDTLPVINRVGLYQMACDCYGDAYGVWDDIPLVRWLNPGGTTTHLAVVGRLSVGWYLTEVASQPVEVVIARVNLTTGDAAVLYAETVDRPADGGPVVLPVALSVQMDADDSLVVTHRVTSLADRAYVTMFDDLWLVQLGQIPEPCTLVFLAAGGAALAARRRRRGA